MRVRWIPIAGLLSGAALLAYLCMRDGGGAKKEPRYIGDLAKAEDGTPFTLEKVPFEDEETRTELIALETCARGLVKDGDHTVPWLNHGNFFVEEWCGGSGAAVDCLTHDDARDQFARRVSTLRFGNGGPYFGVLFGAHWVPPAGWAASLSFSEKGKDIIGKGFGVTFSRYTGPNGPPEDELELGNSYSYTIYEERKFLARGTQPLRAEMTRFITSADALREAGSAQLAKARAEVLELLTTHAVKVREYEPDPSNGTAPDFKLRDATPAEEAGQVHKAKQHFDRQDALLAANYQEMYAAILKAFPVDRCWK
jgi:hypothetical protein